MSAAALVFGIVMGVKAEVDKPPANFITGKNGTYSDLVNRTNQAHSEAVAADIGFGTAVVFAAATTYLYFARPRTTPAASTGSTTVSAAPVTGGGAFFVQGSF